MPDDDLLTVESLRLCQAFFKIRDRKARLRIIALAESTLKLEASRSDMPASRPGGFDR